MKKEKIENLAGIMLFYLVIILGVVVLNARFAYLNEAHHNDTVEQLSIRH